MTSTTDACIPINISAYLRFSWLETKGNLSQTSPAEEERLWQELKQQSLIE